MMNGLRITSRPQVTYEVTPSLAGTKKSKYCHKDVSPLLPPQPTTKTAPPTHPLSSPHSQNHQHSHHPRPHPSKILWAHSLHLTSVHLVKSKQRLQWSLLLFPNMSRPNLPGISGRLLDQFFTRGDGQSTVMVSSRLHSKCTSVHCVVDRLKATKNTEKRHTVQTQISHHLQDLTLWLTFKGMWTVFWEPNIVCKQRNLEN